MNAFQLLKNDHKIVSGLFDQIESSSGRTKTQLFTRLKSELDVHASVEEKIFYPALENKQESREITLEAYEEHKVVKDLLAELAKGSAADEEWDAKLKVLRENVDHHVEEEEGELFDKADKVLSDEDIERLGKEMEAEKARQFRLTPPKGSRGAAKPSRAKSASSRRQADSPGVLKRLANFVGLGESSSRKSAKGPSKGSAKGGKKKAAKAGAKKSSTNSAAKKSSPAKKAGKASKSRASSKSAARKVAASRSGSKKSTRSTRGAKRKSGAAKKR